jgi:transcription termination factor NusB
MKSLKIKTIDDIIEKHLFEYSLYRLAFLDRAIIRLAVYEMLKTDLLRKSSSMKQLNSLRFIPI